MGKNYFDDHKVGEKTVTPGRTITESDIVTWASFTGDWHPIHTDVEYAAKTPFGERIAHGMLVLAVGSALAFRLGENVLIPKSFIALYGMEGIRWLNPVKIGDTIHLESETVDMQVKDKQRGVLVIRSAIKNQRGEECCIYTVKVLCGRDPQAAGDE